MERRTFFGVLAAAVGLSVLGRKAEARPRHPGFSFVHYRQHDHSYLVRFRPGWGADDLQAAVDRYAFMGPPRAFMGNYAARRRMLVAMRDAGGSVTVVQTPGPARDRFVTDRGEDLLLDKTMLDDHVRIVFGHGANDLTPAEIQLILRTVPPHHNTVLLNGSEVESFEDAPRREPIREWYSDHGYYRHAGVIHCVDVAAKPAGVEHFVALQLLVERQERQHRRPPIFVYRRHTHTPRSISPMFGCEG